MVANAEAAGQPVVRSPDWEGRLLRYSNAALEATVFYLLLAAWARPREGPAALLPLVASFSLLAALLLREALDPAIVPETPRLAATILAGLAWSLTAARLCAPPGYWQSDDGRWTLIFGAVFGTHLNAGPQPLAFWASGLLWFRGLMLPVWEPGIDDAFGRFRLGCLVAGVVVAFAVVSDPSGGFAVQAEEVVGVACFLVVALLTTGLARRREMAGANAARPRSASGARPPNRLGFAPLLVILAAMAALGVAAWGADTLSPQVLAPAVAFGQMVLETVGTAIGAVILWLVSLLAHLLPPLVPLQPPALPPRPTPQPGDGAAGPLPEVPGWLMALLLIGALTVAVLFGILLFIMLRRALSARADDELVVDRQEDDQKPTPVPPRGPAIILALLVRLFRSLWPLSRSQALAKSAAGAELPGEELAPSSIRAAYRAFLVWAADRGVSRQEHETPDELEVRLKSSVPGTATEADLLTSLYVDARYGNLPVAPADLQRAQRALTRLKQIAPRSSDSEVAVSEQQERS